MKKGFALVLAIAFSAGCLLHALAEEGFAFRNTRWGMTQEEVLASEPNGRSYASDTSIGFVELTIADQIPASVLFSFGPDGKLYRAGYTIRGTDNEKLEFYDFLKKLLVTECGEPNVEFDDLDFVDGKWDGIRLETYATEQSNIYFSMIGISSGISMDLYYEDIAYAREAD